MYYDNYTLFGVSINELQNVTNALSADVAYDNICLLEYVLLTNHFILTSKMLYLS